ncbi:MAG: VIT domain-containing protein [Pyrinomonadaceae bacterium]
MKRFALLFVIFLFSTVCLFAQDTPETQGSLRALDAQKEDLRKCPLKNTDVKTEINRLLSRVRVVQEFENDFDRPIEAVYTMPLSNKGAVTEMTMRIGERVIRGEIMERNAAREVYEKAKTEGKAAALLDQEWLNIFTYKVANILPGERVEIEISYGETDKFEDGRSKNFLMMPIGRRFDDEENQKAIIDRGIKYRLLTEFTSFVAVEDKVVAPNGQPMRVVSWVQSRGCFSSPPSRFRPSTNSGSFAFPIPPGRRDLRHPTQMANQFADVVDVELSTTIKGRRVVLGGPDDPNSKPEAAAPENKNAPGVVLREILKRIGESYKDLTSLRAKVEMEKFDPVLKQADSYQGNLVYSANGSDKLLRIDWIKPTPETLTLAGGKFVIYRPRLRQAVSGNADKISDSFLLLDPSQEKLKAAFEIKYFGQENLPGGVATWHLELTPKDKSEFKSIELWVNSNGMPVQLKFIGKNDDYSLIRLSDLQKNQMIDASVFELKLPEGTKIIQ